MLCPVKNFCSLKPNRKLSWALARVLEDEPYFDITFRLSEVSEGNRCPHIEIRRKNYAIISKDVFVRCSIRTIGGPGVIQQQAKDEYYFRSERSDDVWRFPTFINVKDLMEKEYFSYTNGVLILACSFSFTSKGDAFNIENSSNLFLEYSKEAEKPNTQRCISEKMFRSGKFSDVSLFVQGRVFKVHKIILSTRSEVFCRMFESDMKENQTGVVDIEDIDPDTMEQLLRYTYTNVLDDLNLQNAVKLYTAADKYNIMPLMHMCRCKITANLSVSTVCLVLRLADTHHDKDLIEDVRKFIRINGNEIFHSQNWKEFCINHKQLAANTVLQVCTGKSSLLECMLISKI